MKRIKVGVIGVGSWGVNHVEAYLGLPHAEVVAVADSSPERAEEVARTYNIPHWSDNYEELCALKEVEAVSIVTPELEHVKPVESAAKAGKHILLEKPVARAVSDIERMITAARRADVILMPGHLLRFDVRYALIKEKLTNRELGNVVTIQTRRNRTKGNFQKYSRVHPIFSAAVHDIDLLLWYAGSKVKRVRGYQRTIQQGSTPDVVWGVIEFASGALGMIETTWLTPDQVGIFSSDKLHLITDKGIASLDLVPGGLSFWFETGFHVPDAVVAPRISGRVQGSLAAELSYFVSCVAMNEKPKVVTAEEAMEGIRIACALAESANKQQDVVLESRSATP
jgi:UDP-N-acetylglucosamine 3-dehydrogenase